MGVQEVVARLNKTRSSLRKKPNAPVPPLPNKKRTSNENNNKQLPPSPIPSPVSSINNANKMMMFDDESDNNSVNGITSLLQKFEQPPTKLPTTPPESPIITLNNNGRPKTDNKLMATQQKLNNNEYSFVNKTIQEIEDLFQTLVDQNNAAEERIQSLQAQVEKYASDATKVRDYEIRVEYLVTKLEQITEERDFFEDQLNQVSLQNTLGNQENKEQPEDTPDHQQQENNINELLDVYEEITPDEDSNSDIQIYEQYQQEEDIDQLFVEADKGVQMTLMKYVTDLEKQKLETKALKEVVKKQDELISKLEQKISTETSEELLKEQVEVQRIELENKRELLAQLLNEREDLLKRLNSSNSPRNSLRKSSLEFLLSTNNSRNSLRPTSFSSIHSSSGRGTPPLTAPPKQPLPPLPNLS